MEEDDASMICLLVRTDGRDDLLRQTLQSAEEYLIGPITRRIIHTDNGSEHMDELIREYGSDYDLIGGPRVGFGGAIDRAWRGLDEMDVTEPFIFDLEDDFLFNRYIPLPDMALVLDHRPYIAQIALRRQPWNQAEKDAGGIVEMWPDLYKDVEWGSFQWLEHRLFWTTNPSLYRHTICNRGWPVEERSERYFSDLLFENRATVSAFWGSRWDKPWCHHIGEERVGVGY